MAITDESVERPTPPAVSAGDLVARYTFAEHTENTRFDVDVLLGEIDGDAPEYVDEFAAYAVAIKSAARVFLTREYDRPALDLTDSVRRGISFSYDQQMLLRGYVATPDEIKLAVDSVMDNGALRASELAWQTTVAGFSNIRVIQRVLYAARNATEMDQPFSKKEPTNPEIRVDILSFLGGKAFDAFLAMPPVPR